MSPGKVSRRVVADRSAVVSAMVEQILRLPLASLEEFTSDMRNVWTVDSCLRRSLEALFDIGRHILARGYARGVTEYKEIARELASAGALGKEDAATLEQMAGYRNRLVHFYHEINPEELREIASSRLGDITGLRDAFVGWMKAHPEQVDDTL